MSQDPQELYNEMYYKQYCGNLAYERIDHWLKFFGTIAERIHKDLAPKTALDAGCAIGILVEALRQRGIDAQGFDISEYAISQVPPALAPYVKTGSILDSNLYSQRFDLVTCIEVVEHLQPADADLAVENLCRWSDTVLLTSSPVDYGEATHFNVQLPGYWVELFARNGYARVLDYNASYIAPWALLLRREPIIYSVAARRYEDSLWIRTKENIDLRNRVIQLQQTVDAAQESRANVENQVAHLQAELSKSRAQGPQDQGNPAQLGGKVTQLQAELTQIRQQAMLDKMKLTQLERHMDQLHQTRALKLVRSWYDLKQRVIEKPMLRWRLRAASARIVLRTQGPRGLAIWAWRGRHKVFKSAGALSQPQPIHARVSRPNPKAQHAVPGVPSRLVGQYLRYLFADGAYERHAARTESSDQALDDQTRECRSWAQRPLLSVVTPVFNPPTWVLNELIFSLRSQTYDRWEWVIGDASTDPAIWDLLTAEAAKDPRIKPFRISENQGISANTNACMERISGDFIVFCDHDDTLASFAFYEIVKLLNEQPDLDFIYSDEDKIDEQGRRCEPLFKPGWSPEMMLCANTMCHVSVLRSTLVQEVGYLDPAMDGSQDWDYYLRIGEHTKKIARIPKILYHWRKTSFSTAQTADNKPYVVAAQTNTIRNHLLRLGLQDPEVFRIPNHPILRVHPLCKWTLKAEPLVSIVIPSRDNAAFLARCLTSIFDQTSYGKFEVIIVDNRSIEAETFALYRSYKEEPRLRVVGYNEEFNFARACNIGAANAQGSLILFLNNDTEIQHEDWLQLMVQWFELPDIGMVGPKLRHANGTIQSAGTIIGLGGVAAHLFGSYVASQSSMFGSDDWYRNCMSVTAACMMVRREAYDKVGGFDERYRLNFQDVVFGVRVYEAGYRIVYTPHVTLLHHEAVSRKQSAYRVEWEMIGTDLGSWLEAGDPYFNPNLSLGNAFPTFARPGETPLGNYQALMRSLPNKERITIPDDLL